MQKRCARKPCVLVVEDHPDTMRYLTRLLRMHGVDVHEATNCEQAVDLMTRERCRVMVSDVSLPDCSGFDLMRQFRGDGVRGVAVSGHVGPEHARAARNAGFERYIPKPFKFDELVRVIDTMLN